MGLIHWIFQNKFISFLTGTALIQGYVFAGASFLQNPEEITLEQPKAKVEESVVAALPSYDAAKESENFFVDEQKSPAQEQKEVETAPAEQTQEQPAEPQVKVVKHTIGSGDNLSTIWKQYGAPHKGSLLAAKAFEAAGVDYKSLWAGEVLELEISDAGDIVCLKRKMRGGKTFILIGNSSDGYKGKLASTDMVENERVVVGTIRSSLSEAALEQKVPYTVIDQLVDIFGSRVVFTKEFQPGDEFTIIYPERHCLEGSLLDPGPIKAASLRINGSMMAAVRHVGKDGVGRYFDEKGNPLDQYFLRYPVQFTRISSVFSFSRFHPVLNVRRPHNGIDFAAPTGTPVRTVGDGVVVFAGWSGGGGNMVKISHGDRWETAYLHLSKIDRSIRKGARVTRGQVIGAVGQTGLATGPHLHFSLFDRGSYVDPMRAQLPAQPLGKGNTIKERRLTAVVDTLSMYHQILRASLTLGLRQS